MLNRCTTSVIGGRALVQTKPQQYTFHVLLANTKNTEVTLTRNLVIGHVLTVDETDIMTIPTQSDIPQKLQQSPNKSFKQKRV